MYPHSLNAINLIMAAKKNDEVAALEMLRNSSAEMVHYLESINEKLMQMNRQNESMDYVNVKEAAAAVANHGDVIYGSVVTGTGELVKCRRNLQNQFYFCCCICSRHIIAKFDVVYNRYAHERVRKTLLQRSSIKLDHRVNSRRSTNLIKFPRCLILTCSLTAIQAFTIFVSTLLNRDKCLAILLPNAVLLGSLITAWCICELRDPSKPKPSSSWFPPVLHTPPKESRYCVLCNKNSPGLDHHCTWLNTCIAESNYEAFFSLVVSASCQTLLQTIIGILMCTLWQHEVRANAIDGWDNVVIALLWIHNVAGISLTSSFVLLTGFHTYLMCVGMGTFDYILANGTKGLCTRMLKCDCLQGNKRIKNQKRSHVKDCDRINAVSVATRTKRGSSPTNLASLRPQVLPQQTVTATAYELSRCSDADQDSESLKSHTTEIRSDNKVQPDTVIHVKIKEGDDVFDEIDLTSP